MPEKNTPTEAVSPQETIHRLESVPKTNKDTALTEHVDEGRRNFMKLFERAAITAVAGGGIIKATEEVGKEIIESMHPEDYEAYIKNIKALNEGYKKPVFVLNKPEGTSYVKEEGLKGQTSLTGLDESVITGSRLLREYFVEKGIIDKNDKIMITGGTEHGHHKVLLKEKNRPRFDKKSNDEDFKKVSMPTHWGNKKVDWRNTDPQSNHREGADAGIHITQNLLSGNSDFTELNPWKGKDGEIWRRFQIVLGGIEIIIMDETHLHGGHLDISFVPVEK